MDSMILPSGDNLKTLLSQSKISKSEVKSVLRGRGVFCSSDEKNNTVPLLIKTLVSPSEYYFLQDGIKTKEHSTKINMRTLKWDSEESLIDSIGDDFNLSDLVDDPFCNYEVTNVSNFYVKDNDDSIALDFTIKRIDLMNGWHEAEQYFSGRIELEKNSEKKDDVEVNISLNHTSQETKLVADKILRKLNSHLKAQGHIKQDAEILKIQFNHFDNAKRIQFLENIAKSHVQNEFYFQKIIDVDFYPDETTTFPDDLKWLERNIEELKLKGTLGESIFFRNKSLHPNLKISKLVASYTMQDIGYDAECKISYEFPEYSTKKSEVAELVIDFKAFNGKGASVSKINEIKASIMKTIEAKKVKAYDLYKLVAD
ncbi:GapS4b family protein [Hafnia paralvei]|uniref:GapS4b family protein n=1 Tax=Hafnia paralvei TaxID=546367 RepID=UPI003C2B8600